MIINSLVGMDSEEGLYLYSGGWDKFVKAWKLEHSKGILKLVEKEKINVDFVVNVLANGDEGELYAAGGNGYIVRIDVF